MGLNTRVAAVADSGSAAAGAAGDAEEGFAQLLTRDGSVVDSSGGLRGEALSPSELQRASSGEEVSFERRLPGIEGSARVLAAPGRPTGSWSPANRSTTAMRPSPVS